MLIKTVAFGNHLFLVYDGAQTLTAVPEQP